MIVRTLHHISLSYDYLSCHPVPLRNSNSAAFYNITKKLPPPKSRSSLDSRAVGVLLLQLDLRYFDLRLVFIWLFGVLDLHINTSSRKKFLNLPNNQHAALPHFNVNTCLFAHKIWLLLFDATRKHRSACTVNFVLLHVDSHGRCFPPICMPIFKELHAGDVVSLLTSLYHFRFFHATSVHPHSLSFSGDAASA